MRLTSCATLTLASSVLMFGAAAVLAQPARVPPVGATRPHAQATVPGSDGRTLYLRAETVDTRARPSLLVPGTVFEVGRHYVLQLDGPMTPARRAALAASGAKLGDYLPVNAYISRLDGVQGDALLKLGFIAWVGAYESSWKLSPDITPRVFATPERRQLEAAGKKRLVATLFADADPSAAARRLEAGNARLNQAGLGTARRMLEIETDARRVAATGDAPEVMFVEEAAEGEPRNATTTWICQSDVANSTPLWDAGLHGEEQLAGIIDWQMRETHCAFSDPNGNPIGPTHRKIQAYYGLGVPSTYACHGTHVAGVFAGEDPNQTDPNLRGLAYAGRIVFQNYPAIMTSTNLNDRLTIAHSDGARVHNNSWGSSDRQYIAWCRDIDLFTHDNEDDLVLVAITDYNVQVQAPENAKNCLAVAATQDTPNEGNFCYGGFGPTLDGRQKPEVWAPGCGSISAGLTPCGVHSGGGTSYACPAVAAMGVLVRQYFMNGFYPTGAPAAENALVPSGSLLKAVLINSAVDMTGMPGYFTVNEGWGRILVDDALYFRRTGGDPRRLIMRDVRHVTGLQTGESQDFYVAVRGSAQPLKVTLVWADVPATLGASFTPVNNLDLRVTDPQGTIYFGNVFSGGESAPGGAPDVLNNAEQVHRTTPTPGGWHIEILGTAVNQGPQGYAVVVTGNALDGDPCGDMDADYDVDGDDYAAFLAAFGASVGDPRYDPAADYDADGVVSLVDYQTWLTCYRIYVDDDKAQPPPPGLLGDMNGDGGLDGLDIQGFVNTLLDPQGATPRDRTIADMNGDQQWDSADVVLFVNRLMQ